MPSSSMVMGSVLECPILLVLESISLFLFTLDFSLCDCLWSLLPSLVEGGSDSGSVDSASAALSGFDMAMDGVTSAASSHCYVSASTGILEERGLLMVAIVGVIFTAPVVLVFFLLLV